MRRTTMEKMRIIIMRRTTTETMRMAGKSNDEKSIKKYYNYFRTLQS